MSATQVLRRKAPRKPRPARPVRSVLLEIAYYLHSSRPVGRRTAAGGR